MVGVRQFDEAVVLDRALDLFWRRGFAATTMADLATATGVQRGSLYHAYGDKERIFLLAFERYADRFLHSLADAVAVADTRAALTGLFKAAIANMTGGVPPRGCLTTKTLTDAANLSPAVYHRAGALLEAVDRMIRDGFDRPCHRDALTLSPPDLARLIVTLTRGLAVMQAAGADASALGAIARSFIDTVLRPVP